MPGVKAVRPDPAGVVVVPVGTAAQVLPDLAGLCAATGTRLTGLDIDEPTLEKVFLHLTGRGLRD